MCGRFTLLAPSEEVETVFGIMDFGAFPPRYNIAPTQPILIVVSAPSREPGSNLPDREAMLVRWGFIPGWAKDPAKMALMINARAETAEEKPAFRTAMRHRRVLVPSSGFYEWWREGTTKQAYFIRPKAGGIIAFAGLMESYSEPGGSEIDTAAILTTRANADIAAIHDRMPVVIAPQDFARWLDCRTQEPRHVADLLQPALPGLFEAVPVSDRVNTVSNLGPDLIERAEPKLKQKPATKPEANQLRLF